MPHNDEGRQTGIWRRFGKPIQEEMIGTEDTPLLILAPATAFYREHPLVGKLVLDALQLCRGAS
jgi:hypothetical protein